MRRPRGHWLEVSSLLFLFPPSLPQGADTYHDFQPACAVGVMRAVSTPRQRCDSWVSRNTVYAVRHLRLRQSWGSSAHLPEPRNDLSIRPKTTCVALVLVRTIAVGRRTTSAFPRAPPTTWATTGRHRWCASWSLRFVRGGEFDMNETVIGFVNGTVLDDLPWYGGVEKALTVLSPSALCSCALWSSCRHDAFARRVRHGWSSHRSSLVILCLTIFLAMVPRESTEVISSSAVFSWALWSSCRHDAFARRVRHDDPVTGIVGGTVLVDLLGNHCGGNNYRNAWCRFNRFGNDCNSIRFFIFWIN